MVTNPDFPVFLINCVELQYCGQTAVILWCWLLNLPCSLSEIVWDSSGFTKQGLLYKQ